MNPRSGEGSPDTDELAAAAAARGVEVYMLGPSEPAADVARERADAGTPAIGIAAGDGTLAKVAAVAVEAGVPFVPVPFGTRNHFATDVGFDGADPVGALAAFGEGRETRVDIGFVGDRAFLNNVSLGLYASFVHDPRRRTKNRLVALFRMVPAAFGRSRRPLDLSCQVEGRSEHHAALVLLVANNAYDVRAMVDLDARARIDEGVLHAYVVEAAARRTLLALLARAAAGRIEDADGWTEYAAPSFTVESNRPRIHAAIDGEPVILPGRLEFEVRPRALRVLVPPMREGTDDAPRRQ